MSRLDKSKVINSALELLNEVGIEGLTSCLGVRISTGKLVARIHGSFADAE